MTDIGSAARQDLEALRVAAGVRLTFGPGTPVSRLRTLNEWGGYRVKFPDAAERAEAILLNTGGGVAGGDTLRIDVDLEAYAALTFTTQSAERIYRSTGDPARVDQQLTVGSKADLTYIPQEAILYQKARLKRTIAADIASDSSLLIAETVVFGRSAMGESVTEGTFSDSWRIRRGGKLIYADEVQLAGPIHEQLQRPALGQTAQSIGTVLYVSPEAPDRCEEMRRLLAAGDCRAAASTWNAFLCVRLLGSPAGVRKTAAAVISGLSRRPLPRVWCP
jgi:urease accessory protein